MNFDQLVFFLSVADKGSFTRAGDSEYISKQALLKQINNLESEVGIPLFTRDSGGVALNEEGRMFYRGAQKLLEDRDRLVADCRSHADYVETLRLSNVEHQKLLTPVTNEFIRRNPGLHVSYVIHPNHAGEFRVSEGIVDVGETFYDPEFLKEMKLPDTPHDVQYTRLTDMPYMAVVGKSHPMAGRTSVRPDELIPYRVSFFRQITRTALIRQLQSTFSSQPEALDMRFDVDNQIQVTFECTESDRVLVTCNPYIYYLPDVRLLPIETDVMQEYGIITSLHPTPTVERYRELAQQMFRKADFPTLCGEHKK